MPSCRLTAAVVGGVLAFSSHAVPFGSWNIDVASWNIAAVNNNPFEYWISYDNPAYVKLMDDVQAALDSRDHQRCGALAPPCGLYLAKVDYDVAFTKLDTTPPPHRRKRRAGR